MDILNEIRAVVQNKAFARGWTISPVMMDNESTAVAQRGLKQPSKAASSAKAAAQLAALRMEGAADVNQELAEIGLSAKTGWYASTLLYGVGGIVTVAMGLLMPDQIPVGVTILGGFAILLAILSFVGALYLTNADWATHVRLFFGLGIFLVGAVVAGNLRLAFVMLPLFVLITPTFLYGARFAAPYVIEVTSVLVIVLLATPGPGRIAHAIITTGAMLMIVISFMAAEHRTRSLARANRRLAYTDALTGIANTRRLRERLTEALGKPFGSGQPFALYAIDLDNFKLVNDTFDHTTGDRVLSAVAAALDDEVDADDLVARRGGDEFSVLVSRPEDTDLEELTVRLEHAIERARRSTCPQITPSGSVAYVRSRPDDSIALVLQRADDELHAKKRAFHEEHGERDAAASRIVAVDSGERMVRITDRNAAMRSVQAAVNRAYSRRSGGTRRKWNDLMQRARNEGGRLDPIWAFIAAMNASIGIALLILSAAGLLAPLPLLAGLGTSLGLCALGGLSYWAARAHLGKKVVPLMFLGSIAFTTVAVALAGQTGTALIDIYVVIALYSFYFMPTRQAFGILLLCCGLYIGFAVGSSYPYGEIRAAVTVMVMLVTAALVIKVRSLTLRFVRTNRELSEVDALTGVANLRALKSRVAAAIAAADPDDDKNRPVLVTVDLDRFKQVNDRYNHTVGDQVLESVARAVSECVRMDEMVARRGGDEFFVLFDKETPAHIKHIVPRIEEAVSHARMRICPDLTPTASVGFVCWQPGQDVEAFMGGADGVMHDEKIETRERNYERLQA